MHLAGGNNWSRGMVHSYQQVGGKTMKKFVMAALLATSVSLSACATNSETAGDIAQGVGQAVRDTLKHRALSPRRQN